MEITDKKNPQVSNYVKLSQHVKVDMGSTYCIISCSKHRLPDLVKVIDDFVEKGWLITSGLTSDDGLVFQALTKISNSEKLSTSEKGV
tara:strand:- start:844 stop:1107 length:264 start_codon:yes stop_codon:yes gene_type:complete